MFVVVDIENVRSSIVKTSYLVLSRESIDLIYRYN